MEIIQCGTVKVFKFRSGKRISHPVVEFNRWDTIHTDECRLSTGSFKVNARHVDFVKEILKSIGRADLAPAHWSIIKSLPGGRVQARHFDYNQSARQAPTTSIPASLLIALNDNASLHVWDGETSYEVFFNSGEALLFFADVEHGGAAYDSEHFRLFCYLASATYPATPTETYHDRD